MDDHLFGKLVYQSVNGPQDEVGAVVRRYYFDPFRKGILYFFKTSLYPINDVQRVLTVAHHDDSTDDFALPV